MPDLGMLSRSTVLRYSAALLVVAFASLLRGALTPSLGEGVPFIVYFPCIVLAAWFGGLGPGLLATGLGGLVAWYLFIPPRFSFDLPDRTVAGQLIVFLLAGVLISLLAERLQRARQRAEASGRRMREEREQFRVTLASIGDAVIATDAEGHVTLMNQVAEALTGWALGAAAGRPLAEVCAIVHERTQQPVENPALRAIREGRIVGLANHSVLITRDGRRIPIDDSGAPIRDGQGAIVGAVLVIRDISERRRAADRFRLAVESAPSAMLIVNQRGEIVLVNEQAERLFGYERRELLGQRAALLVPEGDASPETAGALWASPRPETRAIEREVIARRKDGTEVAIEVGLSPLEIEGELMTLASIVDVTDRRAAALELQAAYQDARTRQREAESLAAVARSINTLDLDTALQKIVESASGLLAADVATLFRLDVESGHMTLAAAGGPLGATLARNVTVPPGTGLVWLAVERREAVASDDLLNDPRFVHAPAMRARIEAAPHRAGLAVPLVVQGRTRGALFVGVLPGRSFSADETRLVTAFADQAAIVMANAELYHDAERANRAKDEFLAMLGHELRNPLGAIAGAAGVLKATASGGEAADRERARAVIERQVEHLARLVDDLLDVSRVTTGKVRLERQRLDLGALVGSAMSAWRAAGRFARHEVALDLTSSWVEADETRLEQVVGNLVGNALKYTPAGGGVTVRVRADGPWTVLEVADTGAGIPPNLGERIFELFVQGDRPLDRAQGGLGIGLTLVKALVGLHGGTVDVRSEGAGRGSVFVVRLPAVPRPAEAPVPAPLSAPPPARLRIVLIEDNDDAREILRVALTLAGHQVWDAADGRVGVELVASRAPDVAIIDVGLPGLDGYEVARLIRTGPRGASVRLIALTGYGQAEDRQRALSAGFDAHLTKPIAPDRLAAAIADVRPAPRGDAGVPVEG
jgi:PAS domain S-box-containing protein